MTTTHTPTPWIIGNVGSTRLVTLITSGGRHVATTGGYTNNTLPDGGFGENEANAAYIVECVNAHAKLVEFVRTVKEYARVRDLIREATQLLEELKL